MVEISYDEATGKYKFVCEDEITVDYVLELEFKNIPELGNLVVRKVDSVTGETIKNRAIEFKLTKVEQNPRNKFI